MMPQEKSSFNRCFIRESVDFMVIFFVTSEIFDSRYGYGGNLYPPINIGVQRTLVNPYHPVQLCEDDESRSIELLLSANFFCQGQRW
ncbi:Exosome complex component RRP42 [Trichinella pseudospiralis]